MRRLARIGGGLAVGGVALKFVPTPVIVISVFVALSYFVVRLLVWAGRGVAQKFSEIEVQWPDLGVLRARRRMAEVMAMADQRILELKDEVAAAQTRAGELEAERHKFDGVLQMADRRIEELQRELRQAQEALQAADEELCCRPPQADPLFRRVGLDRDCPPFVWKAVRSAYRKHLHPDHKPAHLKPEAERRFKDAELVFAEIARVRGFA